MGLKRISAGAVVVAVAMLATAPAWAFYDDVHYHMTYLTARLAGFTPLQSYRIAAANLAVNHNATTEPVQMTGAQWAAGEREDTPERQMVRVLFHAYGDDTDRDGRRVPAVIQGPELRDAAVASGNPGVWLHFEQDRLSHDRVGSSFGIAAPFDPGDAQHAPRYRGATGLPMAYLTDWLAYWPVERGPEPSAEAMTEDLRRSLVAYGKELLPRQRLAEPTAESMRDMIRKFQFVNPLDLSVHDKQLYEYWLAEQKGLGASAIKAYGFTDKPQISEGMEKHFEEIVRGPSIEAAQNMTQVLLKGHGFPELIPDFMKAWREYTLDVQGEPAGDQLDRWVIVGSLRVAVEGPPGQEPVDLVIGAVPTRKNASMYQLASLTKVSVPSAATFEHLPVGDLVVRVRRGDKLVAEQPVTLDKRLQEVTVAVGAPVAPAGPSWVLRAGFPLINATNAPNTEGTRGGVAWSETTLKELSPARMAATTLVHRAEGTESTYEWAYVIKPEVPRVLYPQRRPTDIVIEGTLAGTPPDGIWPFFSVYVTDMFAHLDREPNSATLANFRHEMLGRMGQDHGDWITSSRETIHLSGPHVDEYTTDLPQVLSMDLKFGGVWVIRYEWELQGR